MPLSAAFTTNLGIQMKKSLLLFVLPVVVIAIAAGISVAQRPKSEASIATQETLIVDRGNIEFQLDVNRLNGLSKDASVPATLRFHAAPDSFFQQI